MKHFASRRFWDAYGNLPADVCEIANRNYERLKRDPFHPSLRFKKVGGFWSVRVGLRHRALAVEKNGDLIWFWIGSHADYDALVGRS